MTVSKKTIFEALENSMFVFPSMPGRWESPDFPGLRAHATPQVSHPIGNQVGGATLSEANADAAIAQVQEFFGRRNHMVGWLLNPSSTQIDLVRRLEAAGFTRIMEQAGQVLTNLAIDIPVNPAVTVRQATPDDRDDLIHVYSAGFPIPEELADVWIDVVPRAAGRHYLAFLEGVERPVAAATMVPYPNSPVVVMQSAATLAEYRGQGAYTALMAKRLVDARAVGLEAAVIQALRQTSAPICAKLGFEEVCSIDLYAWSQA